MIKAGILSDTHQTRVSPEFLNAVRSCFSDCEVVIHAGDIIDVAVLDVFQGKTVHAVHGNVCNHASHAALPSQLSFELGGFKIGLAHGDQLGKDIESGLIRLFPDADCLIYGHTHRAVCRTIGGQLIVNPGSFQISGRYGAPCTYAILEASDQLRGAIHEFSLQSSY